MVSVSLFFHLVYPVLLADKASRILLNVLYCAKINRDKANGRYVEYEGCGDDREPEFTLVL